jgi:predicted metal-dependent phosphoesterase TrpH
MHEVAKARVNSHVRPQAQPLDLENVPGNDCPSSWNENPIPMHEDPIPMHEDPELEVIAKKKNRAYNQKKYIEKNKNNADFKQRERAYQKEYREKNKDNADFKQRVRANVQRYRAKNAEKERAQKRKKY